MDDHSNETMCRTCSCWIGGQVKWMSVTFLECSSFCWVLKTVRKYGAQQHTASSGQGHYQGYYQERWRGQCRRDA